MQLDLNYLTMRKQAKNCIKFPNLLLTVQNLTNTHLKSKN